MVKRCIVCKQILKGNGQRWCKEHYLLILKKRLKSGPSHPSWKGGRTMHSRGYVYVKNREHPFSDKQGYIFEHRLIIEKKLGRFLKPKEIVHHINGNKSDNRIENLELMTQGEHLKNHGLLGTYTPDRDPITGRWISKN